MGWAPELARQQSDPGRWPAVVPAPWAVAGGRAPELAHQQGDPGRRPAAAPVPDRRRPVAVWQGRSSIRSWF